MIQLNKNNEMSYFKTNLSLNINNQYINIINEIPEGFNKDNYSFLTNIYEYCNKIINLENTNNLNNLTIINFSNDTFIKIKNINRLNSLRYMSFRSFNLEPENNDNIFIDNLKNSFSYKQSIDNIIYNYKLNNNFYNLYILIQEQLLIYVSNTFLDNLFIYNKSKQL